MIQRFERFSIAISVISRYWHKIASEEMEKYGLKGPHSIYLTTLYRYPEGITAAKLSELCGKDKADVSRMMAIMQEKGLIYRNGKQNQYRAPLKLTEQGTLAAEHVRQRAATAVALAGVGICDADRTVFYDTLEQIANNLQAISQEGLPQSPTK